jgi:hypothetical protein
MQPAPSLLRTGLATGWSFAILSLALVRLGWYYDGALATTASALLPDGTWLERFGGTLVVYHTVGDGVIKHATDSLMLHSGVVIILALVAGTPGRSWLWRLAAGIVLGGAHFLFQAAGMAVFATMLVRTLDGTVLVGDALIGFAIFWALTPLVVGALWTWRFWLPALVLRPLHVDYDAPANPPAPDAVASGPDGDGSDC